MGNTYPHLMTLPPPRAVTFTAANMVNGQHISTLNALGWTPVVSESLWLPGLSASEAPETAIGR